MVELSPSQKKLYIQMSKDFIAYVEGKAAVAQLALTKALRLQQIVSGFLMVEDIHGQIGLHEITENPRASTLKELLEDIAQSSKCIVWACFRHDYETIRRVCTSLKLPFCELTGEVGQKEREAAIDAFQSDPSIRVLIGNQGSGGIGANLTASDVSIYYSRNFSLEHDIQSTARNYRGGSERHKSITRYDIVAADTIDEFILQCLENKEEISGKVLNSLVLEVKRAVVKTNGRVSGKAGSSKSGRVRAEAAIFGEGEGCRGD